MSICSQLCQHPGCWRAFMKYENQSPSMLNFCLELKEKEYISESSKKNKVDKYRPAACNYTCLNLLDFYNKKAGTIGSNNTIDRLCEDSKKLSGVSCDDQITEHVSYHFKELHLSLDENPCELNEKVYKWVPGRKKEKLDSDTNSFSSGLAMIVIDGKILPDECKPPKHTTKKTIQMKSPLFQLRSPLVSELEKSTDNLPPEVCSDLEENHKLHINVLKDGCIQYGTEAKSNILMVQTNASKVNLIPLVTDSNEGCTSPISSKDILASVTSPQLPTTNSFSSSFENNSDSKKQVSTNVIYSEVTVKAPEVPFVNKLMKTPEVPLERLSPNFHNKSAIHLDSDLGKSHLLSPEKKLRSTDRIVSLSNESENKDLLFSEQIQDSAKMPSNKQLNLDNSARVLNNKSHSNIFNITPSKSELSHKVVNHFAKEIRVEEPRQNYDSPVIEQVELQSAVIITLNEGSFFINENKNPDISNSIMPDYLMRTNEEFYDEYALSDLTSLSSDVDNIVEFTKKLNFEWNPEQDLFDAINDLSEILSS